MCIYELEFTLGSASIWILSFELPDPESGSGTLIRIRNPGVKIAC
jgi:hypothetical protein